VARAEAATLVREGQESTRSRVTSEGKIGLCTDPPRRWILGSPRSRGPTPLGISAFCVGYYGGSGWLSYPL
jgi:hypothetical protein